MIWIRARNPYTRGRDADEVKGCGAPSLNEPLTHAIEPVSMTMMIRLNTKLFRTVR